MTLKEYVRGESINALSQINSSLLKNIFYPYFIEFINYAFCYKAIYLKKIDHLTSRDSRFDEFPESI